MAIADILAEVPTLQVVNLANNDIDGEGVMVGQCRLNPGRPQVEPKLTPG